MGRAILELNLYLTGDSMSSEKYMRSEGFTLIEMIIVLLIMAVLMAGMYQNYIAAQRGYQLQEGLAELQENARFAMNMLELNVRMAGFRTDTDVTFVGSFPSSGAAVAPTAATYSVDGQIIVGTNNNAVGGDGILNGTDVVSIRFQGNNAGTTLDCLGAAVAADATVVNTFYIDDTNELQCNNGVTDLPLADGVENMQILYGVDSDGDLSADVYQNAAGVAANEWDNIVSVRVAMLFRTLTGVHGAQQQQTFTLLDDGANAFPDQLRRQMFVITISLRNATF